MMATQHPFNKHTKCHLIVHLKKRSYFLLQGMKEQSEGFELHTQAVWQEILCRKDSELELEKSRSQEADPGS